MLRDTDTSPVIGGCVQNTVDRSGAVELSDRGHGPVKGPCQQEFQSSRSVPQHPTVQFRRFLLLGNLELTFFYRLICPPGSQLDIGSHILPAIFKTPGLCRGIGKLRLSHCLNHKTRLAQTSE